MAMRQTLNSLRPHILSVLRVMSGALFLGHGTQKIIGFPATDRITEMFTLGWFAGVFELICGALLVVGFQTRWAAFVASGVMAFAYFLAHAPRNFYPVNNGGDAAILYCFLFFYLVFAGPGPWSVDALLRRDRG
jgi:putative oxidoreductase